MSAYVSLDDKEWIGSMLKQGKFSEEEIALLEAAFDQQTNYDIETITKNLNKQKFLRSICLYKMILFPIEWLLIRTFVSKDRALDHIKIVKLYFKYYKSKISLKDFTKELQLIGKTI